MSYRALPTSPSLTLEDAVEIHLRRALGEAQHSIAAAFGVNPARVSEVLSEKKFPHAKHMALDARGAQPPYAEKP